MDHRDERPGLHRLGCLLVDLALVPAMVGFATEYWLLGNGPVHHVGLWKICMDTDCKTLSADDIPEWFDAVRGMYVMALCLHIMAVVVGCCCVFLESHDHSILKIFRRLEEIAAVLAGVLIVFAITIFVTSSRKHPLFQKLAFDWSFWLTVSALCLLLIGGVFITMSRGDCKRLRHRGQGFATTQGHSKGSFRKNNPPPIYRGNDSDAKRFKEYDAFIPGVDKDNNNTAPVEENFFEKLRNTERVKSFSSLEGFPRMLPAPSAEPCMDGEKEYDTTRLV